MTEQEQLDTYTADLGRIIKGLDRLTRAAGDKADALCKAGQMPESAQLRGIEASMRMAAGMATEAYAKGRAMVLPGGIQPQFGSK